jgi:hypothetical protein
VRQPVVCHAKPLNKGEDDQLLSEFSDECGGNMEQKTLPITDKTFQAIRRGNFLYADKTKYIYEILNVDKLSYCFLSRPRRFGKTLLLDTIGELFQGDRELFRGLWIDSSDYSFENHPVLKFKMNYGDTTTKKKLIKNIKDDLLEFSVAQNVPLSSKSYDRMLKQLLAGLYAKHNVGVVILVDEYDFPVTKHILNENLALDNCEVLHDFYMALKKNIEYIHFVFVTGITRFAMTALDSGPNSFKDISLISKYSGICGFTKTELVTHFSDRFEKTLDFLKSKGEIALNAGSTELKEKILDWYDGYNWFGEEDIFNPYSINNFFYENNFGEYWTLLGMPSHLRALVRENPLDFIHPKLESYTTAEIRKSELINLNPVPILFHSGYLTIGPETTKKELVEGEMTDVKSYILRMPNREVREGYKTYLFQGAFDPRDKYFTNFAKKLPIALLETNSGETAKILHNLLAAISSEQHEPSEKHYHAVLQSAFIAVGLEVLGQTPSSAHGKSDMTVLFDGKIRVVIEVKYCKSDKKQGKVDKVGGENELSAALDKAEEQIRSKDYAAPFRVAGCKVIGVALAVRGRDEVAVRFIEP